MIDSDVGINCDQTIEYTLRASIINMSYFINKTISKLKTLDFSFLTFHKIFFRSKRSEFKTFSSFPLVFIWIW